MKIRDDKDKELFKEMLGESDRAAAIVAVAYLEDRLTKAIKANLRDDDDAANRLLKPTGPIGPLGNKLLLGYLMRLYTKEFRDDLSIFAEVRNMFAHWDRPVHFGYKEVRTKVEKLRLHARLFGEDFPGGIKPPFNRGYARYIFVSTADMMAGQLEAITDDPKHPRIL